MENTILLIDADGDCEEAVSIAGSSRGYRTRWVHTSRDAFAALDRNLSHLRLIVVDVDPGAHGLTLLEAIGSCGEHPPIIVLSGLEQSYMTPIARKRGAAACLGKPIDRQRLARVIQEISARRRVSSNRRAYPVPSGNGSNGGELKKAARYRTRARVMRAGPTRSGMAVGSLIPVLVDTGGDILVQGEGDQCHLEIFGTAIAAASDNELRTGLIDAMGNDAQHKFAVIGPSGKPIFDKDGKQITIGRFEAGRLADAEGQRSKRYKGMPLQSEHLQGSSVDSHSPATLRP